MNQFRYSLFILIGASSYGFQASIVKLMTNAGYEAAHAASSQYLFGLLLLFIPFILTKRVKVNGKQTLSLFGVGILLSLTGVFYAISIQELSASVAIVLLFQFTWIGVLIESIYLRTFPSHLKIISIILLWVGTPFAAGVSPEGLGLLNNTKGLVYGFLAALMFALYLFFSGKAGKGVPTIQRSFIIAISGLLTTFLFISPAFIVDGTITDGLWKYGWPIGLFGVFVPVVFFALGTPHVDSGIAAILGAAELPAAMIGAMLIVGEQLTLGQAAGIVLILIGIGVPQWRSRKNVDSKKFSSSC
ncbi:DMT family transporter [Bacillus sp. B190/17]|uniref:DMT family transporter n=1 Tax=Bacillus lumedeiriae TaxID=3058829 RepID=A0ABW8I9H0_9BACI